MTGEQSVLVFGAICVVVFILLLSRSGKKKGENRGKCWR
jgi:hypothetical protein